MYSKYLSRQQQMFRYGCSRRIFLCLCGVTYTFHINIPLPSFQNKYTKSYKLDLMTSIINSKSLTYRLNRSDKLKYIIISNSHRNVLYNLRLLQHINHLRILGNIKMNMLEGSPHNCTIEINIILYTIG